MPAKTTKSNDKVEFDAMKSGQEAWLKMVQDSQAMMQTMVTEGQARMEKMQGDFAFAKLDADAPIAAVNEASETYSKGMEGIGADWMAFSKTMIEANIAASQEVFAAKTLKDAAEMNATHMQKSADQMTAQMTKSTEMGMKIMQDAMKPLQSQMNAWFAQATKAA